MKKLNRLFIGILAGAMVLGAPSCGDDFLEENAGHLISEDLLKTTEGVEQLVGSLYANIRWWSGYEWAYAVTLYGADEFTLANEQTSECWNTYDNRLQPLDCTTANGAANNNCPGVSFVWNQMYFGISTANLILSKEDLMPESIRNRALGEAYFLRGYNYLRLFGQYGAVVLQTEPVQIEGSSIPRNYERATEEAVLNQIIDDFDQAYNLLPATEKWVYYAWTKYTAAHFLAKALLWRQSERCESWNGAYNASDDLTRAIALCDEVIGACPLETNYVNLYGHWTGPDCAAEQSQEILMAAPHNSDLSADGARGRFGNRTFSYFNPQFSNFSGSYVLRGQFIGLDFQRCMPTEYTYMTFDNVNDSRLWKSFRTVYGYNNYQTPETMASQGCPTGKEPELGHPAIMYILNKKGTSMAQYGTIGRAGENHTFVYPENLGPEEWGGKWVPNVMPLYDGDKYEMNRHGAAGDPEKCNNFCGLNKVEDGTRSGDKNGTADYSCRDLTLARTGETYLIKAECQVRNNDAAGALATINQLRARAEYKAGEDREAYEDGTQAFTASKNPTSDNNAPNGNKDANGKVLTALEAFQVSYVTKNTYCISTGQAAPAEGWGASDLQISGWGNLPEGDQEILGKLGVDPASKEGMIHFILNERTRELVGEWNRWEELSRTNTLIKRARAFNTQAAANIRENKHELRPIPQTFIDQLQHEDGTSLTEAEKAAWQNPGY